MARGPTSGPTATCAIGVHAGNRFVVPNQQVTHFLEVIGGAHHHAARFVDHHLGVLRRPDLVTRHRDERRRGRGHAIDSRDDLRRMPLERVHDRDPVEHNAARAVDADDDLVGFERVQLVREIACRHTPERVDLVVDQDLSGLLTTVAGLVLDPIPRFRFGFRRLVQHPREPLLDISARRHHREITEHRATE